MLNFGREKNKDLHGKKVSREKLVRFLKLFRYIKPKLWYFIFGLIFLALSSSATLILPNLLGTLLNNLQESGIGKLKEIGLMLFGVFILNAVFSYFRVYFFAIVTQSMLARLRQDTFSHLVKLPMAFFSKTRVGELNSRISADIALLQETFTTTLAMLLRQLIIIIGGISLLIIISTKLTLFMLSVVPISVIITGVFGKYIRKLSKKTQEKVAETNVIVEESFTGISNVKAFSNEDHEIKRYSKSTNDVINIALLAAKWRGVFSSFIIFVLFGSIVGVIWYGVYLVHNGAGLNSGDLIKFILYSVFVGGSIGSIADLITSLIKAIGSTEKIFELMELETEPLNVEDKENITDKIGEIDFKNVSFHYPNRADFEVLKDISFTIRKGQQLALVGGSGAGKSTITNLILRFYDPTGGEIAINNKDIKTFSLSSLRKKMAIVPQEVLLFGGSIAENIAYGKPDASQDEIRMAAAQANALEFIESFPKKYETLVGERGIQLSGGQRQRIAIARAILYDPDLLILDEATSSLDSESERLVQDALEKLMRGRTSIVIAHRLSTIYNANHILVLKDGKICEEGKHDELLAIPNGLYKNLVNLQSTK
ncbi:MAG: ABC transporter ATP-binding protein [Bacteroidales bacterium]